MCCRVGITWPPSLLDTCARIQRQAPFAAEGEVDRRATTGSQPGVRGDTRLGFESPALRRNRRRNGRSSQLVQPSIIRVGCEPVVGSSPTLLTRPAFPAGLVVSQEPTGRDPTPARGVCNAHSCSAPIIRLSPYKRLREERTGRSPLARSSPGVRPRVQVVAGRASGTGRRAADRRHHGRSRALLHAARYWSVVEELGAAGDEFVQNADWVSLIDWFAWGEDVEQAALREAGPKQGPATSNHRARSVFVNTRASPVSWRPSGIWLARTPKLGRCGLTATASRPTS